MENSTEAKKFIGNKKKIECMVNSYVLCARFLSGSVVELFGAFFRGLKRKYMYAGW